MCVCTYRHAQDVRELYERKLERANNLYMELCACMLQMEKRERELAKSVFAAWLFSRSSIRRSLPHSLHLLSHLFGNSLITSNLPIGVWSIMIVRLSVCLCLSVHNSYIQNHVTNLHQIFLCPLNPGSILLCCHGDTLCTSGFMDDIIFAHDGPCSIFNHWGRVWCLQLPGLFFRLFILLFIPY